MKIFNWVNKTFKHSVQNEVIGQNVQKKESVLNEPDKEALLKQVKLEGALHGWNGGILTIGTFGFETLKFSKEQKEYLVLDSEEEEDEEGGKYFADRDEIDSTEFSSLEDEELNPLMLSSFGSEIEVAGEHSDGNEEKNDVILTVDGVPLTPFFGLGASEMSFEDRKTTEADESKKKGKRITLADLFLADADIKMEMNMNMETEKVNPGSNEKQNARTKNGLSFAKKFIPRVKEVSQPIKKIQRSVKKMLKKKIHPQIDQSYCLNGESDTVSNAEYETLESVSLLPIQDGTV